MQNKTEFNRMSELDSIRGIAAFIVLLHHLMLGFLPVIHGGIRNLENNSSLINTPVFFIINGTAAVTLFFTLSGYVLTKNFWHTDKSTAPAIIKRYPRLALLCLISTLAAYATIQFLGDNYKIAAKLTNSEWLNKFGWSLNSDNLHAMHFRHAFKEGAFYSLFKGESFLNTSLWTIKTEFLGSILALFFCTTFRKSSQFTLFLIAFVAYQIFYQNNLMYFFCFIAGSILAKIHNTQNNNTENKIIPVLSIIVALLLFCYIEPATKYFSWIPEKHQTSADRIFFHTVASSLLINASTFKIIQNGLKNRILKFFGRISFSLYVIHVPVLLSVGCAVFIHTISNYNNNMAIAAVFITTILTSIILSIPLTVIDEKYTNRLSLAIRNKIVI
jgi:peptidoglycan/LPS O-acetylase OafA/YrhL